MKITVNIDQKRSHPEDRNNNQSNRDDSKDCGIYGEVLFHMFELVIFNSLYV